jgi:TetR/AcrR family transcriptional repressor of bet genes
MSRMADLPAQQAQLSQAVWDVLAGQGIERLTIRAVATAAGCTTGLVMHRFPNRRALLRHARQLLHERTRERVEALEAGATSPRAALRSVLAQGLALDEETAAESIVWVGFLASAVGDGELTALHQANNQLWRERIRRLVSAVVPRWSEDRVTTTAYALIAMVEGTATLASTDPAAYPPARQLAMLDTTLTAFDLSR